MSESSPQDPRLAAVSFDSDEERAEVEWLIARETDPDAPAPSPDLAAKYNRLEKLLSSVPESPGRPAWTDAVLAQIEQPRKRTWGGLAQWSPLRWGFVGGGVLAVAVALIVLRPADTPTDLPQATIDARIGQIAQRGDDRPARDQETTGGLLRVKLPTNMAEVGVYYDPDPDGSGGGELRAKCPAGPHCLADSSVELTLEQAGTYEILLMRTANKLPNTTTRGEEQRNAEADIAHSRKIHVQPPLPQQ